MQGYKLTTPQANAIRGRLFNETTAFNPVQDINGEWFIFWGEVNGHIIVEEFEWVKELTPSEFVPPIITE